MSEQSDKKIPFIVGAYASLPQGRSEQEEYYRLLAEQEWIAGLEIPYPGNLDQELDWLSAQMPAHWQYSTITAIPGTIQEVLKNPDFGLASPSSQGRAAAMEFFEKIRVAVAKLADKKGHAVIRAIELHSAPNNKADGQAFTRSLEELLEKDWSEASLVIEHCDAPRPGRKAEKGFLELSEEIKIAQQTGVQIHINWGRSCLEERDPNAPLAHIKQVREENLLAGLIFSGASPEESSYGYSWIDGHLPMSTDESASVMTPELVRVCTAEAGNVNYLGAKICVPKEATLPERLAMLRGIYEATC